MLDVTGKRGKPVTVVGYGGFVKTQKVKGGYDTVIRIPFPEEASADRIRDKLIAQGSVK